jgi:hypothetical protein
MGLKSLLYNRIKEKNFVSLDELYVLTEENGQKQSTCEKRLRELTGIGRIEPNKNNHGHISGYTYKNNNEFVEWLDSVLSQMSDKNTTEQLKLI